MEEETKYVGVRIPVSLYIKLKQLAHKKQTTLTDIAIESFLQYTSNNVPGLCPSCHTQNLPDSQYCQTCGEPISNETTESLKQHILKLESRIEQLERAVQVGVLMYDNKEMIEKERKKRVNE